MLERAGGWTEEVRITLEDMFSALREVRPSAMKEVTLEVPKVSLSEHPANVTCGGECGPLSPPATPHAGIVVRHWWARGGEAEHAGGCGTPYHTPKGITHPPVSHAQRYHTPKGINLTSFFSVLLV